MLYKKADSIEPGTPKLGPRNISTTSEKNEDIGMDDSDNDEDYEGFAIMDEENCIKYSGFSKSSITFPVTLIENMRITKAENRCEVKIKLRYGNVITLVASSSQGKSNLDSFQT